MIVHVGDWVLRAIEAALGVPPPERGGALLGPPGRPTVTRFEPDPDAECTAASYVPSRELALRVKQVERDQGLELKGLVHSHPGTVDVPSEQDARELAVGLAQNPHLASYLAPLVTRAERPGPLGAHELALPSGKISFHAALRLRGGGTRVAPARAREVPLLRDLEAAAAALGAPAPEVLLSDGGAGPLLAGRLALHGGGELLLLAAEPYPDVPPLALLTERGETTQLPLDWRLEAHGAARLVGALAALGAPGRRAFGPRGGRALTRDPERARLAGWEPRLGGGDVEGAVATLADGLLARGRGLLSGALRSRRVLVAGCGSVGSYAAEQLVRSGVGAVTLVDPEEVEAANLSRTAYEAEDVGRPKVDALARRLLRVAPGLEVAREAARLDALGPARLDALVRAVDLVLAATDDPAAQRALNLFAYARGRPAVFVGLYAGAQGGEVLVSVPERTACYLCATRARHAVEEAAGQVAPDADYGTARLPGEVALGADVQHVASAAVKLALSLLAPPGDGALSRFAEEVVAAGTTYLTLSTVPRYWFYPAVFGDTAGQGAFQSVWLAPTRLPGCPVCGEPAERGDPLEVPLRTPPAEAFSRAR